MEHFETDETLIESKKEKRKEKNYAKIIANLGLILCLSFIFIYIYKNNQLKEHTKLINEEKKRNDDLKQIINGLIKEKNQINIKLNELLKWKENKEKNYKEENEELKYEIDSYIIMDKKEIKLLLDKLTNNGFLKIKKIKFNLIYRASIDGYGPSIYHNKCNGKINTITVIETTDGYKFGGYTETKIQETNKDFKDPNSFLFSLNKMKIYENRNKDNNIIRHSRRYGPYFIGGFIAFDENLFNNYNFVYDSSSFSNFYSKEDEEFEIDVEERYNLRELEVFEIIFE